MFKISLDRSKDMHPTCHRVFFFELQVTGVHSARLRFTRRARCRDPLVSVSWAGRVRWYQRGEKSDRLPADVKSHISRSKRNIFNVC